MSIEYWVTCMVDPWPVLAADDAFGEIVDSLRTTGQYEYDAVEVSLEEGGPAFVPTGSVVLHVSGPSGANWDEVLELLDAIAAAGEGVVFAEDRQIVLDRRSVRPGTKAFNESPAWAKKIVASLSPLEVVVFAAHALPDPRKELERFGLTALASRITVTADAPRLDELVARAGIERGQLVTVLVVGGTGIDPLVAGQALAHPAKGRAFALGPGGLREELPR